jgi:hypothetical protein
MPKNRTKNSRRVVFSRHYEDALAIMRQQPARFRAFSPQLKMQLSVYLDLRKGQA